MIFTNFLTTFQGTQTNETAIADFYKLKLTIQKVSVPKLKPTVDAYRDYRYFVNDHFCTEPNDTNYVNFAGLFHATLEKHTPLKERSDNANQQSLMDMELNPN